MDVLNHPYTSSRELAKRTCSFYGCSEKAVLTIIDRFDVSGIRSVAFYDYCLEHGTRPQLRVPAPGHEQPEIRIISDDKGGK